MKLSSKEKRILSITLAIWALFFIGSGLIMNSNVKTISNTTYKLNIQSIRLPEAQAKTNEIKLKDIELEIDTPLSVDVKDYLENIEKLNPDVLKELRLDTSLVKINQAGTYQYSIAYKKKKYVGNVKIKEKELPNMTFTLKNLTIPTTGSISTNKRDYINETITDEIYNNIVLDVSEVVAHQSQPGNYEYTVIYKDTKYKGNITIIAGDGVVTNKITSSDDKNTCSTYKEQNTCNADTTNKCLWDQATLKCKKQETE